MRDLGRLLETWEDTARRGRGAVVATVVRVEGSAYRRPGARMIVPDGADAVGAVSGGCLESDLTERAADLRRDAPSTVVVYDMRSPDDIVWGLGLGCDGEIRVLLERLDPAAPPAWPRFLAAVRDGDRPAVLVTVFEADGPGVTVGDRIGVEVDGTTAFADPPDAGLVGALLDRARAALAARRGGVVAVTAGAARAAALVEFVEPPPRLLVCGAGHDAAPIVESASALGWRVRVVDHRAAYAQSRRFPTADTVRCADPRDEACPPAAFATDPLTAVVIVTHHFLVDVAILARLADGPARYVGVLGPARRRERLLAELAERGIRPSAAWLDRVYGPAGLDIGSETPAEIALSIVAEIRAVLSGRDGGFLRGWDGPLHDGPVS